MGFRLRLTRGALFVGIAAFLTLLGPAAAPTAVPAGFQDEVVFSGLTNPTALRFSPDGRIFVAEKSGLIKVFNSVSDPNPTVFADLRTNVYNFWDRGLLGLALDPSFPTKPYVYALYTYDAPIGGTAPTWGTPGVSSDPCPTPPGPTTDGCVVSGRLSRLQANGNVMTGSEQVLIEDWCQQFPSHTVGSLVFGPDGALYVSGGEGASFNAADYGQFGSPVNPCGDPPGAVGTPLTPPSAEGGSLRSQDLRTPGDPVTLDGAILRVDPATGLGLPDNPLAASSDANARRIIAYGLRNPFRITVRPGTSEIWLGDVGSGSFEEIDRIVNPTDSVVENFGWPCFEGNQHQGQFESAGLKICQDLYANPSLVTPPVFTYHHTAQIVPGETCPTGSSSISGIAFQFYSGGPYPASYDGALFFADYSRKCIWVIRKGTNGLPDTSAISTFVAPAAGPVDIELSPAGELFYVDFDGGTIHRVRYYGGNQPPTAVATATPSTGPAPLTVTFDGTGSSDPDAGDTLTYSWDLNGDGVFGDSTAAKPTYTYATPGTVTAALKVTDSHGASATATVAVTASNTPPAAAITSPAATVTWKVGDVISFAGSATDQQDGTLPASSLSWKLILHHCPSNCHTHLVQTFDGVASGSFATPDHEYPSYLELQLTATDSGGLSSTTSVNLNPKTVDLTFQSAPPGLQLSVGTFTGTTPFTRTVIVGSNNSASAGSPQTLGGSSYAFSNWSDGGAQTHSIIAGATVATYTANYSVAASCPSGQFLAQYFSNMTLSAPATFTRCESSVSNSWGAGGPGNGVPVDGFSARWSGSFDFPAGGQDFTVTADDGIRVWVDGTLLVDAWRDQAATTYRASRTLTAGAHQVLVEYYEKGGAATAQVSWTPTPAPTCPAGQFTGEYFANMTLTAPATFTRCDPTVAFNWGTGGPGNGLGVDSFSARWTARPTFAAGNYTFTARADDGVRVWVDGVLAIDGWKDQAATTYTATKTLTAGAHDVKMEYYEKGGAALASLSWAPG